MSADKQVHMDVQDTTFIYIQQMVIHQDGEEDKEVLKALYYDYKRCASCGICASICPSQALELGPVQEIATGLDAPPINLDPEKCAFCGLCAALCPVVAIRMEGHEERPGLVKSTEINDKCKPCILCAKSCPEEAIEVDFKFKKKEEVFPHDESRKGKISLDLEKCNFCGVCPEFCDAFILMEREVGPADPRPFETLLIDEEGCDYCGLCVGLCPEEAIKVEATPVDVEAPVLSGEVRVDEAKCTHCGYCVEVCPYEAVEVAKPMSGEIDLIKRKLSQCDPSGCRACLNVCPGHCWYTPETQPVDARKDFCIFCGACELVCPKDIIRIKRREIYHDDLPLAPWAEEWRDALDSLVSGERWRPDLSRVLRPVYEETPHTPKFEPPPIDKKTLRRVDQRLSGLIDAFDDVKTRYLWGKLPTEPWTKQWNYALDSLVSGERWRPDLSRVLRPVYEETPHTPKFEPPPIDKKVLRRVDQRLSGLLEAMGNTKTRYLYEKKDTEDAADKIVSRLS